MKASIEDVDDDSDDDDDDDLDGLEETFRAIFLDSHFTRFLGFSFRAVF